MFDYDAAAELFLGHSGIKLRNRVGYRRFSHASAAVLFAVESLPPEVLNGTFLEVNEQRFNAAEIRSLYDNAWFPLAKRNS